MLWLCLRGRAGAFLVSFYLLPHALYAELARRLFGIPTIPVTLSEEDVKLGVSRWPYAGALAAAHAVGVRGAHSARLLEAHGIPADRIFNPPNLYDPDLYLPDPAVDKDIDVLYVGNLVAVKRLDMLLNAAARLAARRPGFRLVLVGDGVLRGELEALAKRLALGPAVAFAGARPFEEIAQWLRRSRVFVMTSEMEGLPQAMIEAMSCGVPVVLPDTGDVTTIARHGENALDRLAADRGRVRGRARPAARRPGPSPQAQRRLPGPARAVPPGLRPRRRHRRVAEGPSIEDAQMSATIVTGPENRSVR